MFALASVVVQYCDCLGDFSFKQCLLPILPATVSSCNLIGE
uniref:Uncharacterized protein n=1 Tax=Arundo donax TaxID=35708 RepID=A0A0A9EMJ5_ARUDO